MGWNTLNGSGGPILKYTTISGAACEAHFNEPFDQVDALLNVCELSNGYEYDEWHTKQDI